MTYISQSDYCMHGMLLGRRSNQHWALITVSLVAGNLANRTANPQLATNSTNRTVTATRYSDKEDILHAEAWEFRPTTACYYAQVVTADHIVYPAGWRIGKENLFSKIN